MEYQKITNLLGTTLDEIPRFITKKWVEVHDQSGSAEDRYKPSKQIRFKTSMLRSDLCDFSDAFIVMKGEISVARGSNKSRKNKSLTFTNNGPFISCISKINNMLIDNAEDLDVVMPMYNFLDNSKNYSKTTGSLWNYYRDELTDDTNDNNNPNKNAINTESFKYKTGITGSTYNVDAIINNDAGNQVDNPNYDASKSGKKEVEIAIPLEYLSNFWRTLNIPLINCKVPLILTWSENLEKRVIINTWRDASLTNATFKITDTKLYVSVVTLSTENDKTLLEQLKTGFKRTIEWNKYRSEMTN